MAVLWGIAFAVYFAPYVIANRGVSRDYGECLAYLPSPASWLKGPMGSRWFETLDPIVPEVHNETCVFAGFGLYLLVLVAGVRLWRSRRAWPTRLVLAAAAVGTAAIWWLLTLDFYEGVSAWWLIRFLPGGGAIRCVSRVCFVIDLFAILGTMMWLSVVTDRIRTSWKRFGVIGGVAAVLIVEQTGFVPPSFAKDEFYPRAEEYAERIRNSGADAAYVVPKKGDRPLLNDVLAMWAALEANVPVVNGYSGRKPPDYPYDFEIYLDSYEDDLLHRWLSGRFRGRLAVLEPGQTGRVRSLQIE
jgi:hypothetical protein